MGLNHSGFTAAARIGAHIAAAAEMWPVWPIWHCLQQAEQLPATRPLEFA